MHEVAIARALLGVADRALPSPAPPVRAIRIAVGDATGIVPEALLVAFRAVAAGSGFAAARLIIEPIPARCRCGECGAEYRFAGLLGTCPGCGALGGDLLAGDELELRGFEVADV